MNTSEIVLGVLGVCWVGFVYPPQLTDRNHKALRALCWVCWVFLRARACARRFHEGLTTIKNSHARANKPNTLNTHYTNLLKYMIYKCFSCVGCVLGWAFFVSGSVFRGKAR